MRQFYEKIIHGFNVINGKIEVFLSFLLSYISLAGSVTIANGQIEWSQSTNFNRIQDGAWHKSSYVKNPKFRKLSNLGFSQVSAMF